MIKLDIPNLSGRMPDYAGFAKRMGFNGSPDVRALVDSFQYTDAAKFANPCPALPPAIASLIRGDGGIASRRFELPTLQTKEKNQ